MKTIKVTDTQTNSCTLDRPYSFQEALKDQNPIITRRTKTKNLLCMQYNRTITTKLKESDGDNEVNNVNNVNDDDNSDSDSFSNSDSEIDFTENQQQQQQQQHHLPFNKVKPQKPKIILKSSSLENTKSIGSGTGSLAMSTGTSNGFVFSAYRAYSEHHNLEIRPDDIWIAILVQLSSYINANSSDKLRDKFVDFKSNKKRLKVVVSDFSNVGGGNRSFGNISNKIKRNISGGFGRSTNIPFTLNNIPNEKMTIELINQISNNFKDENCRNLLIPNFSTTTDNDRLAGSILVMSSFQKYFNYKFQSKCGIPSIHLHGTVEDYQEIKERIQKLLDFDLGDGIIESWVKLLEPIADNLISSVQDNPNLTWWNQIASHSQSSGTSLLSGWITAFCYFDYKGIPIKNQLQNFINESPNDQMPIHSDWLVIDTFKIPRGYASVKVDLKVYGKKYKTKLYAGHMSVDIHNKNTIQPRIDWCMILLD